MSDTLHHRDLTAELHRIASGVTAPRDGRHRVTVRLARRRRRRRHVRAGVASLLLLVVVPFAVVRVARGTDRDARSDLATSVGQGGADQTLGTPPAVGELRASEPLPRLVIEHPDYPPVRAQIDDVELDPQGQPADVHLQSFRTDARAWDLPMVFVRTTRDPTFGVGDLAPPEMTTIVDVNGSIGYLVENPSGSQTLGWRRTDGTAALIVAPGLDRGSLVRFGRAMEARADGRGWEVEQLPPELVAVVDAQVSHVVHWRSQELQYGEPEGPNGFSPVSFRTVTTTPTAFEELVADRAADAQDIRTVEVRGAPAAVISAGSEITVLWSEHDGTVGHELRLAGRAVEDLDELLVSIAEKEVAVWEALVDRLPPA